MAFMEHEIVKGAWYVVETNCGTEVIPAELARLPEWRDSGWVDECASLLRDYLEGNKVSSVEEQEGYGARLSAPGYLDCTEWAVFDTEEEAQAYLVDMYGDEEEEQCDE